MDSKELELQERDSIIGELESQLESLAGLLVETKESLGKAEGRWRLEEKRVGLLAKETEMLKRHLVRSSPSLVSLFPFFWLC